MRRLLASHDRIDVERGSDDYAVRRPDPERPRRRHRPAIRHVNQRRLARLAERDLPRAVVHNPACGELEAIVIVGNKEEQRGGRRVEVALHVAEIEPSALIRQAARLVEPPLRAHKNVREAILAIADRVAVDLDDIAKPEPAVDRVRVHEREVGRDGSRLRRASWTFRRAARIVR